MTSHFWGSKRRSGLRASRGASLLTTVVACTLLAGCGNTLWAMRANNASTKLEEAREVGAEELAPYEFWMASEHLKKAREEAADADYSDAIDLAEESEEFAEKAIRLARDAHRGAGR